MKIQPLHDRVVLRRIDAEQSGIIIVPDAAKEESQEGEIIAAGKGKLTKDDKLIPIGVKVGDRVVFSKYAGTEIKIDGEDFVIMHEKDVLGVIEL